MKYVFAILLILIYLIFGPLLFIWSLNTLFNMNILYTFDTWIASYIFLVVLNIATNQHTKIVQNRDDKYKDEKAD
jgi:membrane protein implicated in regulation of membrane protease activity